MVHITGKSLLSLPESLFGALQQLLPLLTNFARAAAVAGENGLLMLSWPLSCSAANAASAPGAHAHPLHDRAATRPQHV